MFKDNQKHWLVMLMLTLITVGVHGYHLGADDSAIYVPAIKRVTDPGLYPFGAEFFMKHAGLSLFPDLVGDTARMSGLAIDSTILLWHVLGVLLLLCATWQLLEVCFVSTHARWGGVVLMAGVLSVPVAGTALAVMDPYLTARSLSTPATLFAVASYAAGKWRTAVMWLLLSAMVHPQMALYGIVFIGCMWCLLERDPSAQMRSLPVLPVLFDFAPSRGAARECLLSRTYFLVSNWAWYEWVGAVAPLALCWWLSRREVSGTTPAFRRLLRAVIPFGVLFTALGLLLASSSRFDNLTRLQPMRAFHLVYLVFFALLGGLLGEFVLRDKPWRWCALFLPLAASMWIMQVEAYPASRHVEWPGASEGNVWSAAFYWIRANTPKDALFALDPGYMLRDGEDQHGFRAIAERSMLADAVKDSGAVSLFPQLAEHWKAEVVAQQGLERFKAVDFRRLASLYPVTWIVTGRPVPTGLVCPYQRGGVAVCRIAKW